MFDLNRLSIEQLWMLQSFPTFFMTGLISFCHLSVYKLFQLIDSKDQFSHYHSQYTANTGWTTAPFMVLELAIASWIFLVAQGPAAIINLVSALSLWIITFLVQVKQHARLNHHGRREDKIALYRGNLSRVLLWWGRSVFLLILLLG